MCGCVSVCECMRLFVCEFVCECVCERVCVCVCKAKQCVKKRTIMPDTFQHVVTSFLNPQKLIYILIIYDLGILMKCKAITSTSKSNPFLLNSQTFFVVVVSITRMKESQYRLHSNYCCSTSKALNSLEGHPSKYYPALMLLNFSV